MTLPLYEKIMFLSAAEAKVVLCLILDWPQRRSIHAITRYTGYCNDSTTRKALEHLESMGFVTSTGISKQEWTLSEEAVHALENGTA